MKPLPQCLVCCKFKSLAGLNLSCMFNNVESATHCVEKYNEPVYFGQNQFITGLTNMFEMHLF